VRGSVALLVDFTIGSRGNTSVHLRSGDVQLLRDGLDGHCVRLRALKGKVLVDTLIGDEKVIMFSPDAVEGHVPLIQKWDSWWRELGLDRGGNKKDSWYRLPGEEKTWNWNMNQIMNVFMGEVLLVVGVTTPHSFARLSMWLTRSMAVAYATYIDPLCPTTLVCYSFFGWLLPPTHADLSVTSVVGATFRLLTPS
jgi:hypothetical protein